MGRAGARRGPAGGHVSNVGGPVGEASPATGDPVVDPMALMRSRQYRGLLVAAALIGVLVSVASWCFLELTHDLQQWVYVDLPEGLGFDSAPWWWPLPVLALAGLVIAFAVVRLPGRGGHEPSEGLKTGGAPTTPVELPGVILAALATIGLGLVLGPEAPLIALGMGLALFVLGLSRRPVPNQARLVLAAAASFAALATIFGSPVIGAVIIIEAAGLGGPTLPLVLLPGLLAAGIGSLVFVGMGSLTGLSSNAYALPPLALPPYPTPQFTDFLWTIALALAAAVVVFAVMQLGLQTRGVVAGREFIVVPAAALLVGVLAIAFAQISGQSADSVLFWDRRRCPRSCSRAPHSPSVLSRSCWCAKPWRGGSRWAPPAEADLPRDLPGPGWRTARLAPTRARGNASRRSPRRCGRGLGPEAAPVGNRPGVAHHPGRRRGRAAGHRRRSDRLHRHAADLRSRCPRSRLATQLPALEQDEIALSWDGSG